MATSGNYLNDRVSYKVSTFDKKGAWYVKVELKPKGNYWNDRVTPEVSTFDKKGAWYAKVELKLKGNYNLTHHLVYEGLNANWEPQFCVVPKGLKDKIATEDGDVSPVVGSSGLKRKVDSQKGDGPMKKAKSKKEQVTTTTVTTTHHKMATSGNYWNDRVSYKVSEFDKKGAWYTKVELKSKGNYWNDRVTPEVSTFIDSKDVWNMKVELKPKGNYKLTHHLVYEGLNANWEPQFCVVPKGLKDKIPTEDGDVSSVVGSSGLKRKVDSQKGDGPIKKAKSKKDEVTSTSTSSRYTSFPVSGTWKISSM